jgi:hypothetical protein
MADRIVIDEFHLTLEVPRGLPDSESEAIRRTLDSARFQVRLRRAAQRVCGRQRSLVKVRVQLSR